MSAKNETELSPGPIDRRGVLAGTAGLLVTGITHRAAAGQHEAAPTVLITGSNRGIGLEFARQYTEAGWNVIATCRNPEQADELNEIAGNNGNIVVETLDVTDYDQIDALAEKYKDQPIDVLLNNAGIFTEREGQLLENLNYGDFERTMAVNAYGPLKMAQAFADQVAASDQKKIVTIVSGLGSLKLASGGRSGGMYYYRMSKAAANMAMVTLKGDLAGRGIILGLIGPGMVETDLLAASGYKGPALSPADSAAGVRDRIARLTEEDSGRFLNFDDQELPW